MKRPSFVRSETRKSVRAGGARRRPGRAGTVGVAAAAVLSVATAAALAGPSPRSEADDGLAIATVAATTNAERQRLMDLGVDVIEFTPSSARILLHGDSDRKALAAGGWRASEAPADDQVARMSADRARENKLEERRENDPSVASALPTGRVSYRTLDDAEAEMRELAARYPDKVELFELSRKSLLGTPIMGMEITTDVRTRAGKPVFLTTGLHHAREWPTLEFTLEFAWDVLESYGSDDRITDLVDSSRMIIVPAVNPDGYTVSRERIFEMKRKNCRVTAGEAPTWDECTAPESESLGVDLNRNYGAFWGGPGSSASPTAGNHHGAAPYSEPEIAAMTDLLNSHQVMVAVNNHTPDARLLRAPASPLEPVPAEVEMYDGLAQELGAALDWPAGPWTEIYYVASGVAEQQALYATGTFGFTPELTPGHSGLERFHPPYEYVVDQYHGTGFYEGSSIREALLLAWEAAADPAMHSVVTGTAPRGIELTISKEVSVDSSPVEQDGETVVLESDLEIETTMQVPRSGEFEWHVLPSARQSQYASELMDESWVVSCRNPAGKVHESVKVTVGRGETATVDLSDCPKGPKRPNR